MKSIVKFPAFLAAGALLASAHTLRADEIKYADLEQKITIDKTPIASEGGVVVSYAPALAKVMPAVVRIASSKTVAAPERNQQQEELFRRMFPDIPEEFFERRGQGPDNNREQGVGSGVIISADGYILTNNHVVGGADEIKVTLPSEKKKEYVATVVGADPQTDVALIKIDAKDLPHVAIGDSSALKVGDIALAVGNPHELDQTATIGIISAVGRTGRNIVDYENFIQTDAAINRGNSGGALVDANGRLIGIPTAIQTGFSGGNIGIGFAIPSNMALNIVQRLLDGGGVVKRGAIGVLLRDLDPNMAKALGRDDRRGVLIAEVGDKTPAAEAGLKAGDIIVGYAGKPAESVQQLRLDISNTAPGSEVPFEIDRKGERKEVAVKLGDLDAIKVGATTPSGPGKSAPQNEDLVDGVVVDDLNEDLRSSMQLDEAITGVLVKSVQDDSAAAEAGLFPGMVITQIDQTDVSSVAEARKIVESFDGDVLLVQVYASGRRDILAIPLKE